jgi:hypothetical protein
LGVPRLVDVVRPGDADEEEQHAEREQVFTHGVEGFGTDSSLGASTSPRNRCNRSASHHQRNSNPT